MKNKNTQDEYDIFLEDMKYKQFQALLKKSKLIIFYTGAGMSAASGIPTFRGNDGLWNLSIRTIKYTFTVFLFYLFWNSYIILYSNIQGVILTKLSIYFLKNLLVGFIVIGIPFIIPFLGAILLSTPLGWRLSPILSWFIYKIFFHNKIAKAKLNDGHIAIKNFIKANEKKKKIFVVTANVDCLEKIVARNKCLQIHGSIENHVCLKCCHILVIKRTIHLPYLNPKCNKCGNRSHRPGCLLFKENFDCSLIKTDFLTEIYRLKHKLSDNEILNIIIGSSSTVPLPVGRGVRVEINTQFKKKKKINDIFIKGRQEIVLKKLLSK